MKPYVLLVEDDALKARTISRIVRSLRSDLDLVYVRTLHDFDERFARALPYSVITDWDFPFGGCGVDRGAGWLAVGRAAAASVPVIVISGGEKPEGFDACFPGTVWARDWAIDLRVFLCHPEGIHQ